MSNDIISLWNTPDDNEPRHKLSRKDIAPQKAKRTWAYYQDMKKRDGKYYESKEVQTQMHKDAMRLGPHFFVKEDDE